MRLPNNMSVRMAAVSAAIVVLLLSAGFTGYRKLGVMEPMKRALSEMEEVRKYEVQGVKGGTRIRVSLSGVDDLAATVARLAEAASSGVAAIGGRQVWLSIEEPRDPLLATPCARWISSCRKRWPPACSRIFPGRPRRSRR